MDYSEKLKDPRWQRKRLQILERDGWRCRGCSRSDVTLHVHHEYYEAGREPWEYPAEALKTLCEDCHERERLMEKLPALSVDGRDIRVTDDKRFSVFDWLELEGFANPWDVWKRLQVQYPEDFEDVLANCEDIQFTDLTGRRTRPTPVINREGAELLAMLLPSKRGAKWRRTLLETFRAVERGDIGIATHVIDKQTDSKTLDWLVERTEAKKSNIARNRKIEECNGSGWIFAHCSDNLNKAVTGFTAKQIKDCAGVAQTRDALSPLQLALIRVGELAQIEAMDRFKPDGNPEIKKTTDKTDSIVRRSAKELKTHDPRLVWDRTDARKRALKQSAHAIGI